VSSGECCFKALKQSKLENPFRRLSEVL